MDCIGFEQYHVEGGIWAVACRDPEEDLEA